MSAPAQLSLDLADETATATLMADLALLVGPGDVIALSGDLGAGKTTAARALIRYIADDDALDVPSPTFTLLQLYELPPFPVMHADLYRVDDPDELEEIGLSPWPDHALVLIEWPERGRGRLPADRIEIVFAHHPDTTGARTVILTGHGKAAARIERLIALRSFLDIAGYAAAHRRRMAGDASTRSYARLTRDGVTTILMNAPRRPDGPTIYGGKSYSAAVHLAEDVRPFVAICNGLREQGLSAPAILRGDLTNGFLITEDFGSEGVIEGGPPAPIPERYQAATDLLASLHSRMLPAAVPLADGETYSLPMFDIRAWLIEIGLMLEWYMPDRGVTPDRAEREELEVMWRELLAKPAASPRTWVLRDFHSPNLIWLAAREGIAKVGLIDFQDTVLGPAAYDVVSLLQDARIDIPEQIEIALLARYARARLTLDPGFDATSFVELYAIMSAQRNTRLLGTFARLNRRDGKPQYLKHQPRIWAYLARSLAHPALAELRHWYDQHVPPPAGAA